ncbi:MAG: aminopeptidase P family protein [Armatimonadetes bacterium]|nr:aminopeptidase P family protein [Armatimonadota bacterium]
METISKSGERIKKLTLALSDAGVDTALLCTPRTMGYFAGFFEDGHERLLVLAVKSSGEVAMIAPALSAAQASRAGVQNVRSWTDQDNPYTLVSDLAAEWDLKTGVIVVDDAMRADILLNLQSTLPAALFKPGTDLLAQILRQKDDLELDFLRTAGKIADETFDWILGEIQPGISERILSRMIADHMVGLGGNPTFSIVGVGAASAEPHHLNEDTQISEGDVVLMDFGCEYRNYQSDITRCVTMGPASDEIKEVYRVVYDAHMAGRDAIVPGATGRDVDRAARKVISDAGYGEYFIHRLGHGIGIGGHEEPNMVESNDQPILPGDCFSIEPGIYLPGKFGIRIENIVTATADGHDSINQEPAPEIIEVD